MLFLSSPRTRPDSNDLRLVALILVAICPALAAQDRAAKAREALQK